MSGDRRVLADPTGALKPVIEGLALVRDSIETVRYALIGGLAVFARVGAYRVTSDVDAVLGTSGIRSRELVAEISDPIPGERHSYELANGIVFDVMLANPGGRQPRRGIGGRRESRAYAATWAISTAEELTLTLEPPAGRGDVSVRVATIPALIALKTVALVDPKRPADKQLSDRADLWRLLTSEPTETPSRVRALRRDAPPPLAAWVAGRLEELIGENSPDFANRLRGFPGAPTADEVVDMWQTLLAPNLDSPTT